MDDAQTLGGAGERHIQIAPAEPGGLHDQHMVELEPLGLARIQQHHRAREVGRLTAVTPSSGAAISSCSARGAITARRPSRGVSSATARDTSPARSSPDSRVHGFSPVDRTETGAVNEGSFSRRTPAASSMISAGVR